jgi:di/tricarboxylate transporter
VSVAALSLCALVAAIVVSCVSQANVGFLAIALAWVVGVYLGGMTVADLVAGFPSQLFLTLAGVTLLFSQAQVNGTLERLAQHAMRLCRGHRGVIPIMFFGITLVLSSIGPGNIAAAALMAPLAMRVAGQAGITTFLMAIMVGNGASAGSLSPFAPAGIVANSVMSSAGMTGLAAQTYVGNLLVHTIVAFAGYFLLGGWRLFANTATRAPAVRPLEGGTGSGSATAAPGPFERRHWITVAIIAGFIVGVIGFDVNVGFGAFAGAVLLTLLKAADEQQAVSQMPWRVIMMVSGVTLLIAMLQRTGGLDLVVAMLARVSTPFTVTGVTAFFTGIISIYSSTSGVVLPALLPLVPGLVEQLGGGDPVAIASSINVGGHLVDVSPLSTIGALCLACAPPGEDSRALFNKLLAWGLSMSVVGALVCWLLFGLLDLP